MTNNLAKAQKIVDQILNDMAHRTSFQKALDSLDADHIEEIAWTWIQIVKRELEKTIS